MFVDFVVNWVECVNVGFEVYDVFGVYFCVGCIGK